MVGKRVRREMPQEMSMKRRVYWVGLLGIAILTTASTGYVALRSHFDLGQGVVAQAKSVDAASHGSAGGRASATGAEGCHG